MASPVEEGTCSASPFISRNVDIMGEKILVIPDSKFATAQFKIEYHIRANKSGRQVPLLFYASEFRQDFKVWIDDSAIALSQVPEAYKRLEGTPFNDFSYFFENGNSTDGKEVVIRDSPTGGFYVSIKDLKFFETDLTKGDHVIRVEYVADNWTDKSNWVKEYSFRYILSPAKYWKSFGRLEITLDASNFAGALQTNLGAPSGGNLKSKAVWTFSALPTDVMQITYTPRIKTAAAALVAISPSGLTFLLTIILIMLHFIAIRQFRKVNPAQRFSWVMITGSILVPLMILLGYIFTYDIIDAAIGQEASRYHGYTFLIMVLYPLLLPVYWLVMWLFDRRVARRVREG